VQYNVHEIIVWSSCKFRQRILASHNNSTNAFSMKFRATKCTGRSTDEGL